MSPILPRALPGADVGLIVIGDEILCGKRQDRHFGHFVELLRARGLRLSYSLVLGDDPLRITQALERVMGTGDIVFCTGGIGATPDDHTRTCAARALGVPLAPHPEACALIAGRIAEMAQAGKWPADLNAEENRRRLEMAAWPQGAHPIPNPYNRIPGFSVGDVHFLPGFPVMAWPMAEWVLEQYYRSHFAVGNWMERSVIVRGGMEAALAGWMDRIEREFPGVKVFSLPSVDHPQWGHHIELGVKGAPEAVTTAFVAMLSYLQQAGIPDECIVHLPCTAPQSMAYDATVCTNMVHE
ncbi:competence/damage-inducible protein A [Candidatus Symbiobacter mobilis]|uniref:Nucleotide-utilizing enzyme-like protein n=1 Tax=Candidatus Symbiobacter mobilis CR TaxID=946483 RepID=U5N9T9_9BURK|nr:molybdopterin-binding protein [Candidatus Symbiobacter mobilis]AGX87008.1 nucleotide-utilizing enzyme-like protein [Candidatus Symbiobacter mobilis CR]